MSVPVRGGRPLRGTVRTPGDKSISHRGLLIGALAEGTSVIHGLSDGADVRHTLEAVQALGAKVRRDGATVSVTGGWSRLRPAAGPLDCGNSGTGMRLLAGVVAGLPGRSELIGDASLSSRPMDRIAQPLEAMGATVRGREPGCRPPLEVDGGALRGIEWTLPVASAQVKSAILLAGLGADGETVVHEPVPTRAHTEELLLEAGVDLEVEPEGRGRRIRLRPSKVEPLHLMVPGDPSQAAFWVVGACLVPESDLTVRDVYAGAERIGFLGVLARMGAQVELVDRSGTTASIRARSSRLRGTTVEAAEIPSLDEVPILAVAAAAADGTTIFRDVGELRVKETDRLAATASLVEALGARSEIEGDELRVHGAGALRHAATDSGGDHRMAMAAAVAALAAGPGESTIVGFGSVATSYPDFLADLGQLGGRLGRLIVAIDGPAGAGKSTVSEAVSQRLGLARLDTGAMYRAVAWAALERGADLADSASIAAALDIRLEGRRVEVDGTDVTTAIRTPEVSRAVSHVAAVPEVRGLLVERQRRWVTEHDGGVVEGRDIGTVVFPEAQLKVFLTADPDERARRREEESADGVARRDHLDSTRQVSPLAVAVDAHELDTTDRTVEEVVEQVLSWL